MNMRTKYNCSVQINQIYGIVASDHSYYFFDRNSKLEILEIKRMMEISCSNHLTTSPSHLWNIPTLFYSNINLCCLPLWTTAVSWHQSSRIYMINNKLGIINKLIECATQSHLTGRQRNRMGGPILYLSFPIMNWSLLSNIWRP